MLASAVADPFQGEHTKGETSEVAIEEPQVDEIATVQAQHAS